MNQNSTPLITILTPTYNRSNQLITLFNSLKKQKSADFVWLIVDDGSTDNTKKQVEYFLNDQTKLFKIKYFYKINGGKHTAINYAMKLLNTPLTIIIDSDDILLNDGIEIIKHYWNKFKNKQISSLTFEHLFNDGKPMVKIKHNVFEKRSLYPIKYNALGDYVDVFVTSELIKNPFPVFGEEKFLNEGHLYYFLNNKSVFIDKPLIIGGYQEDGLTNNIRNLQVKNYKGTMYTATLSMDKVYPLWFRLKNAILYNYVAIKNNIPIVKIVTEAKYPLLILSTLVPALLYSVLKGNNDEKVN